VNYPTTRRSNDADEFHGTRIEDPYRWLEDLDSPETAAWVAAQNAVTEAYLSTLPEREFFRRRITELWDYRKTALPVIVVHRGQGTLFYRMNEGLEPQAPLYRRDGVHGERTLVLDPNAMWPDGTTSLAAFEPSPDLRLLAYAFSPGGADWQTIRVRDLTTGRDLEDDVQWMRFSGLHWTEDSAGFFYSRYPEPPAGKVLEAALSGHAVYYHRVGTPQADDRLIYTNAAHPDWFVFGELTEDGRYLLISTSKGADNTNHLHVVDLVDPLQPRLDAPVRPVFVTDGAECAPIGSAGSTIVIRTDLDAPNRRIVAIDLETPGRPDASSWRQIVPEAPHAIETALARGGRLYVEYLVDVTSRLAVFTSVGEALPDVPLPSVGSLAGITARTGFRHLFYLFTSPLYPATVVAHDLTSGSSEPFEAATLPVDITRYETTRLFAASSDGVKVPFFVTARTDLVRDGNSPAVLYGYGGFAVTLTPSYRPDVPAWLDCGGIWVTANLRGGAEYGEAWHRAGMLERKQQVFDDFIAVAEELVRLGYTSPAKLAIMGGSNGGLLVAAVMQQRPDLFACVLPAVGVLDMLRYDRFTGGRAWVTEYGSSSDPAQFRALLAYSPLHNLTTGRCYPATLITTADHDDRVVPSHSFKFAAALQAAQGCDQPVLIRVETGGSHNFRSTEKRIAELVDEWTFIAHVTGVEAAAAAARPHPKG
jgi:prolyl oligopeptidase